MNRRHFLFLLGMTTLGCQNKAPRNAEPSKVSTPTGSPVAATASAQSSELGTILIRRYREIMEPPEYTTWRVQDDGTATQLSVVALDNLIQNVGPVTKIASTQRDSRIVRIASVKADGKVEVEEEREMPEGFSPVYFLADSDLLVGFRTTEPTEPYTLVALKADGSSFSTQVDFRGQIRDWGMNGTVLGAGPLGGTYHKGAINMNLFRLKDQSLDKILSFDLSPYLGTGYSLGYSFWEEGSDLTVSVGVMDSEKYGDSILMFSSQGDTLKFQQQIKAGFRPPPLHFVNQDLAYAQDNGGDLSTFVRNSGEWTLQDSKELNAGDDYVQANVDNSVLFTQNNPGDIVAFRMNPKGKLSEQISFPELRWSVPGREPERIQHQIARVLS